MDEPTFVSLLRRAKLLTSDYGAGFQRGLRRHFYGDRYGSPSELAAMEAREDELGRGYRDGLAGREPEPLVGRPPLPLAQRRSAMLRMRTYPEIEEKARRLGYETIERLIREAPEPMEPNRNGGTR